jgi:vacuolar-type H+-ATPase subunit H
VQQPEKLLPENINFVIRATVSKMLYDNIDMKNFKGLLRLKKGKLNLENCKLNTLGGSVVLNGEFYEIEKGKSNAAFDFKMNNLNIKQTASKIEMVEKYAPMALYTKGTYSTEFTFRSELDKELQPIYNTVYSKGRLRTHKVKIDGYKPLDSFAEITKTGDILHQQFEDANIDYEIIDGKAFIKPFDFKIDKISGNSFGTIDLEQNLDFLVHLKIPTEMLGEDANDLMGQVAGSLAGFGIKVDVPEFIEMDIEITGKADNPKFKPSITGLSGDDVKEQVKEKLKEEFDNAKEEAKKRAKEEADKIIADAQKEANNLMREAKKQGEALKKEVYKQADDLVENASGFLEKTGAELASKELKKQADQQVDNLLKEAQKQADQINGDARKEAAKIK